MDDEEEVIRRFEQRRLQNGLRRDDLRVESEAHLGRIQRNARRAWRIPVGFAALMLFLTGWQLLRDHHADGSRTDFDGGSVTISTIGFLVGMLLLAVLAVWRFRRGRDLRSGATWAGVGVLVVVLFLGFSGENFAVAQADECKCTVAHRVGIAEAVWLAFDTVPVLKVNDTLGWEEPQPIEAVRGADSRDAFDTPIRRWLPALGIRFVVGIVLLAIVKGVWDAMFRVRQQRSTSRL